MKYNPIAKIGIITKNTSDNSLLIDIAKNSEVISISGVLTAILIIIWKANCTFVTSVVSLVTKLLVENESIFVKEKFCTL